MLRRIAVTENILPASNAAPAIQAQQKEVQPACPAAIEALGANEGPTLSA